MACTAPRKRNKTTTGRVWLAPVSERVHMLRDRACRPILRSYSIQPLRFADNLPGIVDGVDVSSQHRHDRRVAGSRHDLKSA